MLSGISREKACNTVKQRWIWWCGHLSTAITSNDPLTMQEVAISLRGFKFWVCDLWGLPFWCYHCVSFTCCLWLLRAISEFWILKSISTTFNQKAFYNDSARISKAVQKRYCVANSSLWGFPNLYFKGVSHVKALYRNIFQKLPSSAWSVSLSFGLIFICSMHASQLLHPRLSSFTLSFSSVSKHLHLICTCPCLIIYLPLSFVDSYFFFPFFRSSLPLQIYLSLDCFTTPLHLCTSP